MDSIAVLDEVSVAYSNQAWMSIQAKIFRTLLTTQGYRRNTLILTLPHLSHLLKSAIQLSHFLLMGVDRGVFRCYRLRPQNFNDKIYFNGFEVLRFDLPKKENIEKYELMKDRWNKKRGQEDIDFMTQVEDPATFQKPLSLEQYLKGYFNGLISFEDAKKKLTNMGFNPNDIEMALQIQEIKRKKIEEKEAKEDKVEEAVF